MVVPAFDPHFARVEAGEITPISLTRGRVPGGYSIYGYRCFYVTFSDGSIFSTSLWMYPDTRKSLRRVEEAFNIKLGEDRAADLSKAHHTG